MRTIFMGLRAGMLLVGALVGVFVIPAIAVTNVADLVIPVIKFEDTELETVIDDLARRASLNYLFDPVTGWTPTPIPDQYQIPDPHQRKAPRVTINWTNLTARQALTGLLAYYDLHLAEIVGTTVSKVTMTNRAARPVDTGWMLSGTNTVIPLVEMSLVPLDEAIKTLASQAQLRVALSLEPSISPELKREPTTPNPTLRLRWTNVTARQAIAALCENYGLVVANESNGLIRISRGMAGDSKGAKQEKKKVKLQAN